MKTLEVVILSVITAKVEIRLSTDVQLAHIFYVNFVHKLTDEDVPPAHTV